MFVLQAADVELALYDGVQQIFVIGVKQVEPGVAETFQFHRCDSLSSMPLPGRGSSIIPPA